MKSVRKVAKNTDLVIIVSMWTHNRKSWMLEKTSYLSIVLKGHAVGGYAGRLCIYTSRGMEQRRKNAIILSAKYRIWRFKKCCSSKQQAKAEKLCLKNLRGRLKERLFVLRPTHACTWRDSEEKSARRQSPQSLIYRTIFNIRSTYSTISFAFLNFYISKLAKTFVLSFSHWENGGITLHLEKTSVWVYVTLKVNGDFSHWVG